MADCTDSTIVCWISGEVDVLKNIAQNLQSVDRLITGAAYLMGLGFAIKALMSLKELGESRTMMSSHKSIKEPLVYFLVATMLIYLPTAFATLMNTTFGYSSVLSYVPVDDSSPLAMLFGQGSLAGSYLAVIIQTIGLIAFVRGWILISRSANQGQPGMTGKGLIHIFGGVLAMNIVGTLQMIDNTLYGTS